MRAPVTVGPGPLLTFPEMEQIKFLLLALTVFSLGIGAQTKKTEPVKINPEICKTCKNLPLVNYLPGGCLSLHIESDSYF